MDLVFSETQTPSYFLNHPPPPPPSTDFNLNNKVSPSVLLIIIILSIIFFISGLLPLLVRFLLRSPNRDPNDLDSATAFQGQLQQLFHLHDSGVDQSFIDTLPVFSYKAIVGGKKNPFDCAVCLCEFEQEDKLRLLPICRHAFHMECIDTWILSQSTCPICRTSLLPEYSESRHCFSPRVLLPESGSQSARENVSERDGVLSTSNSVETLNSHLGFCCSEEFDSSHIELSREIEATNDENQKVKVDSEEKIVSVKLGKFRDVDGGGGEGSTGDINIDARRCFSMGSFAYVMDEKSLLRVPIRTPMKKQSSMKASLPLKPGHRPTMSECGFHSTRDFASFQPFKSVDTLASLSGGNASGSNVIGRSKRESFSVSKIWLRVKKEMPNLTAMESTRRAFSFRFPVHRNMIGEDELKPKIGGNGARRTISEIDIGRLENGGGSELSGDQCQEHQSCNSLDSQSNPPSFARSTMLWLVGRKSKIVHSSFSPDV